MTFLHFHWFHSSQTGRATGNDGRNRIFNGCVAFGWSVAVVKVFFVVVVDVDDSGRIYEPNGDAVLVILKASVLLFAYYGRSVVVALGDG